MYYTLDENNKTIKCSLKEWIDFMKIGFEDSQRVAKNLIGEYEVSTVFLGIDHNFGPTNEPLLFETMIFGEGPLDEYQTRCSTWDEALEMHKNAIECIKKMDA